MPKIHFLKHEEKKATAEADAGKKSNEPNQEQRGQKMVREVIQEQYRLLGPMTFHEVSVFILFLFLIFLWFFREPQFIPGWGDLFRTT